MKHSGLLSRRPVLPVRDDALNEVALVFIEEWGNGRRVNCVWAQQPDISPEIRNTGLEEAEKEFKQGKFGLNEELFGIRWTIGCTHTYS